MLYAISSSNQIATHHYTGSFDKNVEILYENLPEEKVNIVELIAIMARTVICSFVDIVFIVLIDFTLLNLNTNLQM